MSVIEHRHYFVERELPSGLWISEERCTLTDALMEVVATAGAVIEAAVEVEAACPDSSLAAKAAMN